MQLPRSRMKRRLPKEEERPLIEVENHIKDDFVKISALEAKKKGKKKEEKIPFSSGTQAEDTNHFDRELASLVN